MKNFPRSRGAALVVTLGILVLVLSLVLAFFLNVTSDRTDTAAQARQWDAQRLSQIAVDLVKSTVTQATSGYESNADGSRNQNRRTAWASQPGLIRSWDESGAPYRTFRLYSSGNLSVEGALDLSAEFADLSQWKSGEQSLNGLWCDLNAPAVGLAGDRVYPIVTPPRDTNSGSTVVDVTAGIPTDNPSTSQQEGVQGFRVSSSPGFVGGGNISATNNPVPMPVRWLYVLQDGSIVTPGGTASVVTVPGASDTNQIVGRIAYWADDETGKVNINTASEGVFWDTPYGINAEEKGTLSPLRLGYSLSVPVSEEFQRQAGHPAFTSLSAVLGGWLPRPTIGFGSQGASTYSGGSYSGNIVPYYRLSPRIASGGTLGGTVATPNASPIVLQSERLYATADEILYPPNRNFAQSLLSPADVAKLPFFITATSRAPETNLFERPRVALWPLQAGGNTVRNAKDRLIAQAATLNGNKYYFERSAVYANSGSPGSSQSTTQDLPSGGRNEQLLLYLRSMLQSATPGFGASFAAGKPSDSLNRLLVQSFDTVRSLVNTTSRALAPAYSFAPIGPGPAFEQFVNQPATGSVVPIRATNALGGPAVKGHGRFPVIREIGIIFQATSWLDQTTLGNGTSAPTPGADGLPDDVSDAGGNYNGVGDPQTTGMRAVVYFVPLLTSPGQPSTAPAYRVQIEGLDNLTVNTGSGNTPLGFPAANNAVTLLRPMSSDMSSYPDSGFFAQFTSQSGPYNYHARSLQSSDGNAPNSNADNAATRRFPFFGSPVALATPAAPLSWGLNSSGNYTELRPGTTPTTFSFSGGTVTVRIFSGTDNAMPSSADAIQTYTVTFPPATLPVPFIVRPNFTATDTNLTDAGNSARPANNPQTWQFYCGFANTNMDGRDFGSRLASGSPLNPATPGGFSRFLIWRGDVVRAMQLNPSGPSGADARIIGGLGTISESDFAPAPNYSNTNTLQAHGIAVRQNGVAGNINSMTAMGFFPGTLGTNPHTWLRNIPGNVSRGRMSSLLNYTDPTGSQAIRPYVPPAMDNVYLTGTVRGDWNTGIGNIYDGSFINKADEGFVTNTGATNVFQNIYFPANLGQPGPASLVSYSPTRQIPSPVIFGGLALAPWRTLLFCPNPAAKSAHPGFGGNGPDTPPPFANRAPDHLFLDHFVMPVPEPYAITEPSSTDGKINLNFQLAPFTHIERSTGLHALMRAMKIPALRNSQTPSYKREFSSAEEPNNPSWRHDIDIEATVAGMRDRRFRSGTGPESQGFRSASEITTVFLVPKTNPSNVAGPSGASPLDRYNNTADWWDDKVLTGDNLRESPYGQLYSRVTTKSNTFTVFYRVQALRQVPRRNPAEWGRWEEGRDQVLAEFRGDTTIERYVDPNDPDLPDFAAPANANRNLSEFYRWRTLRQRQFLP
ncbi:MAG: hypothetical protein Fur0032_05750 [Terrimicrobiaceae bacterium]